jgi:hypothetical protein
VRAAVVNTNNLSRPAERPSDDVKARLLIALTALYVERASHSEEEKQQYAELSQRLIDVVDEATRATVARILQNGQPAPFAMSEPSSQAASPPDANLGQGACSPVRAARDLEPAGPSDNGVVPVESGEAFFAATAVERRNLLTQIARRREGHSPLPVEDIAPAASERLDTAALQGWIGEFKREFARLLDLPDGLCERIINDPSGEPIVVAATAMRLPLAVLQRVLLLVNPAVGHSVERVFDLTNLAYELDRGTAVLLMSLWRDAARREATPPAPALVAMERSRPGLGLRARFSALSARVKERGVTSRSDPESDVRRDLRSR